MWGGMVPYAILKGRNTLERVGRSDLLPTLNAYGEPGTNFGQPLTDTASHHLPIQDRGERLREAAPYFAEHVRQADDREARVQRDVAAQEPIHGSRRARASSRRSREPRRAPPLVACPAGPPRRRSAPCPSADSRAPSAESGPGPPDRCAADPERAVGSSTPNADATRCDASAPPCRRGQRGGQSAASPRTGRGWTPEPTISLGHPDAPVGPAVDPQLMPQGQVLQDDVVSGPDQHPQPDEPQAEEEPHEPTLPRGGSRTHACAQGSAHRLTRDRSQF